MRRSSFETKIVSAFAAAVLVVMVLCIATAKLASDAGHAQRLVAHTQIVLNALSEIRAATLQIELSTQSYRISGDAAHLARRDHTIASRESVMSRLAQLTADNAGQQPRWAALRSVLDERIAISRRIEHLRAAGGADAANAYANSAPLQQTRSRAYDLIADMEQEELRLLEVRSAEQSRMRGFVVASGSATAVLLFALLAAIYWLIRRQLRDTALSQRALLESEESLRVTLRSIGDAVIATDAGGRIAHMNPVAERMTGWTLAQAEGRHADEVLRLAADADVAAPGALADTQHRTTHDAMLAARDGSECPVAHSTAPIRDSSGRLRGMVTVLRDMRLERQAQRSVREQNDLLERRVQERTAALRESEQHLRSVISNVPAMIAYVDAAQRYVYVNRQYHDRFAPDRIDIAGHTVREILGEARYAIAAPLIDAALRGEPQHYDWQPFTDVWQAVSYVPRQDADGATLGYYVLGIDITERKMADGKIQGLNDELAERVNELERVSRALRTLSAGNRAMLRAVAEQELLESMCEAIVTEGGYDMATVWYSYDDARQSLRPMAQRGYVAGLEALRALKTTWADNAHGQGAVSSAIRSGLTRIVRDIRSDPGYLPWRDQLQGDGSSIACPLRIDGKVIGALAIYDKQPGTFGHEEATLLCESADDLAFGIANLRARAERRRTEDAMVRLLHYDGLTGLPNEAEFMLALSSFVAGGRPFALLQVDVERLSEINDALGFVHGDAVLKEFGSRLAQLAVSPARVARLRGDEFAVLLPEGELQDAVAAGRAIEQALAKPFLVADITLDVSARVGLVLFPAHGTTPHDLLRNMDIAVQQARREGMRHWVFDASEQGDPLRKLGAASELRRAIEGGDLLLHLQPKVDMKSLRVVGAEGLVRWQHAERGLVPPGEFIELAEHTGLIDPLTEWVIEAALRLNGDWIKRGCALPIAVNLSARNLRDEKLPATIARLQEAHGLPPGLLELEITESTLMHDAELALRVLHELHAAGIPLYIDDFGTGYSSLSYLQKLPVHCIKIDQSFVRDMSRSDDSAVIVRSTIDLAHDLGRVTVAEGIEDRETWDRLATMGCDTAQGYFIARPMPSQLFPAWVERFRNTPWPDTG